MVTAYSYTVEAFTTDAAAYVATLLQLHGLAYEWQLHARREFRPGDTRVCVRDRHAVPIAELIFSDNPALLRTLGIASAARERTDITHVAFLDSDSKHFRAVATHWPSPVTAVISSDESTVLAQLITGSGEGVPLFIQRSASQLVFAGSIAAVLDKATLGPDRPAGSFEDWAEAFENTPQSMALACPLEHLLRFILDTLTELSASAFPAVLDYFPPGRTAPLLVTGDTDDATNEQIDEFLSAVERAGGRASLLVRSFASYSSATIRDAVARGHGIGLHPFSDDGSVERFQADFAELLAQRDAFGLGRIGGVRNHRFQWIARAETVALEHDAGVGFDLNCVAASGCSWLGSASGLAFPIPFWPMAGREFSHLPLHLPTSIEDDVYLYDHDYCYKRQTNGDSFADDLLIRFLDDWVLRRRWPVVANLHPEHVTTPHNRVMDAVLEWASTAHVWMPTLESFLDWIEARLACRIHVIDEYTVQVMASRPMAIRASSGLAKCRGALRVVDSAQTAIVSVEPRWQCLS